MGSSGVGFSDACGAPVRHADAFVAARPSHVPREVPPKPVRGGSDLDDLVGDLFSDAAKPADEDGMVPGLQCTQCDHQVMRMNNVIWNDAVDYMFCRNFYPDTRRLRRNQMSKKGCSAFCCQCSWKSADRNATIADVAEGLRWTVVG